MEIWKMIRDDNVFVNENVLITGGTGSLGKTLLKRLLSCKNGSPNRIGIFSRDESKQDVLRNEIGGQENVRFFLGDVADQDRVFDVFREFRPSIVVHAAAYKQVPSCEYAPNLAVRTNILGAKCVYRACANTEKCHSVVAVSTDKACKPVNVMGMTKSIQERIFTNGNHDSRMMAVRYGNVLASRGSVIPFFLQKIREGKDLPITHSEMTRFLLPLEKAVDTIVTALVHGHDGETIVPEVQSAKMTDLASVLLHANAEQFGKLGHNLTYYLTGIRPGEKIHEILISEEETGRTIPFADENATRYYAIESVVRPSSRKSEIRATSEYSSKDYVITQLALKRLLEKHNLLYVNGNMQSTELLG
jgi:FlaA1/EpsC-like NDP-sugar epimerase